VHEPISGGVDQDIERWMVRNGDAIAYSHFSQNRCCRAGAEEQRALIRPLGPLDGRSQVSSGLRDTTETSKTEPRCN
jgi:hypothetical protein